MHECYLYWCHSKLKPFSFMASWNYAAVLPCWLLVAVAMLGTGVPWAVQGIADLTSCTWLLHSHLLTDALLPRNYIPSFTLLRRLSPSWDLLLLFCGPVVDNEDEAQCHLTKWHSRVQLFAVTSPCHCALQRVFSWPQTHYNCNVVHLTISSSCPGSTYH